MNTIAELTSADILISHRISKVEIVHSTNSFRQVWWNHKQGTEYDQNLERIH